MSALKSAFLAKNYSKSRWALRAVEMPYDAGGFTSHHSFLMLADESERLIPLDTLHFTPAMKGLDGDILTGRQLAGVTGQKFLTAEARDPNPDKDYSEYLSRLYISGSPNHLLAAWNQALQTALVIKGMELPFSDVCNCRTGTKAVLQTLGYTFSPFNGERMYLGTMTSLTLPTPIQQAHVSNVDNCMHMRQQLA